MLKMPVLDYYLELIIKHRANYMIQNPEEYH